MRARLTRRLTATAATALVAVLGSGGGLGLLLLTSFIVHTVRRQRRDRVGPA